MELFNNDEDDQSQEVNGEINAKYDVNYPPLTKWTKDHPKSQDIGEIS